MSAHTARLQREHRAGYVEALADIAALLATTPTGKAERVEQWILDNTTRDDAPILARSLAEFQASAAS